LQKKVRENGSPLHRRYYTEADENNDREKRFSLRKKKGKGLFLCARREEAHTRQLSVGVREKKKKIVSLENGREERGSKVWSGIYNEMMRTWAIGGGEMEKSPIEFASLLQASFLQRVKEP